MSKLSNLMLSIFTVFAIGLPMQASSAEGTNLKAEKMVKPVKPLRPTGDIAGGPVTAQAKSCPNGGTLRGGLCHAPINKDGTCPSCCPDKKGSPGSEYCTGSATESVKGISGGGRTNPAQVQSSSGR